MRKAAMTLDDARFLVKRIRQAIAERDFEAAHGWEDALHIGMLEAIAKGAPDARLLALAALRTKKLEFPRHCG